MPIIDSVRHLLSQQYFHYYNPKKEELHTQFLFCDPGEAGNYRCN